MPITARAFPRKNFFIQMFTKDISLEDCLLDLIDNSIDGYISSRGISLDNITKSIFDKNNETAYDNRPKIELSYTPDSLIIKDNCGGIDLKLATEEVFNFGHSPEWLSKGYLGVYGIGLKRALFKLGKKIEIKSQTQNNGFTCELDVEKWLEKDEKPEDWSVELNQIECASDLTLSGTQIQVTRLHPEVSSRIKDPNFITSLYYPVSKIYMFFLKHFVSINLNSIDVTPYNIPLAKPKDGSITFDELNLDDVSVKIYATVAQPNEEGTFKQEHSGWYVICNGRVVLAADKTSTTGWGSLYSSYHPKYRSFIGLVFFETKNPLNLPWTTTKRNLNKESSIYQTVMNRMHIATRSVLNFLDKQYQGISDTDPSDKKISSIVNPVTLSELYLNQKSTFSAITKSPKKSTVKIQYDAGKDDIEKIKKHLRKPGMSARSIGELTFNYYLKQEGLDD